MLSKRKTRHVVAWRARSDVSSLQGHIVRLKVCRTTTRLYSFWFKT